MHARFSVAGAYRTLGVTPEASDSEVKSAYKRLALKFHPDRIEQLFGVVIIAYTWAYCIGIAANIKVKAVRILNNGRRAISLVKYGLNFIADALLNPFRPSKINVFDFLSCT